MQLQNREIDTLPIQAQAAPWTPVQDAGPKPLLSRFVPIDKRGPDSGYPERGFNSRPAPVVDARGSTGGGH
jgi:hypothetical protein